MKAKLFMTMAAAMMILAGCSNDENEIKTTGTARYASPAE